MEPRISIITLGVADLARSVRFYRDGLGFPTSHKDGEPIAFFSTGGARLALYPLDKLAEDISPALQPTKSGFSGITLAHKPKEITLLQVVEHFEGELYLSDCILKPGECPFETRCPVHCQWVRLKNLLRDEMARITFQQLVEEGHLIESNLTTNASHVLNPVPVTSDLLLPSDIPA